MFKRLKIFLLNEVIQKVEDVKSYSQKITKRIYDFELKLQKKIDFMSNNENSDLFKDDLKAKEIKSPYDYDSSSLFDY